jgi:predicted DNA-binding transcriptional regulator AlpA
MSEPTKNPFELLLDAFRETIRSVVREELAALNGSHAQEKGDYLTPEQAAKIMGVDTNWLYRHRKTLPFAKGLSKKALRFDEAGLRRWMQSRK